MKSMLFTALTSLLLAATAQAEGQRVLVVMKSPQTFRAYDYAYKARGQFALKSFNLNLGTQGSLSAVDAKVVDSFSNINTLVMSVDNAAEVEKLKSNPDVAMVENEVFHPAPRPYRDYSFGADIMGRRKPGKPGKPGKPVVTPPVFTFNPTDKTPWGILAVKAPQAWGSSNQGAGARVLILDTGIDKDHPSLKANFETGKDFVNDQNTPYEFADSVGHGTHVAGTIAGVMDSSGFTGVAPQAKVLAGRVCSEQGCSNISIAAGINWGIQQKVDVISMSLGGMMSTPAERVAIQKADQAGITVVAAAGNDGDKCSAANCRVSYPAALPTVIAVGAIDSKLAKASFSQYGPELAVVAPGVEVVSSVPQGTGREAKVVVDNKSLKSTTFQGAREVKGVETNELVDAGLGKVEDFQKVKVAGKFALISRGEIAFGEKVKNAITAGAKGAIIYNNAPGLLHGALTQDGSTLDAAVFMIEQDAGLAIAKALAAGQAVPVSVSIEATDYSPFDGTSMATPHVSGVVALMKAANKALKPAQVKSILKATATKLAGSNTNNELGSGLVDADLAVQKSLNP